MKIHHAYGFHDWAFSNHAMSKEEAICLQTFTALSVLAFATIVSIWVFTDTISAYVFLTRETIEVIASTAVLLHCVSIMEIISVYRGSTLALAAYAVFTFFGLLAIRLVVLARRCGDEESPISCETKDSIFDCAICLDVMKNSDAEVVSCGHVYHGKCLSILRTYQNQCPLCKADILYQTPKEKVIRNYNWIRQDS